jgi:hypothetical protein
MPEFDLLSQAARQTATEVPGHQAARSTSAAALVRRDASKSERTTNADSGALQVSGVLLPIFNDWWRGVMIISMSFYPSSGNTYILPDHPSGWFDFEITLRNL